MTPELTMFLKLNETVDANRCGGSVADLTALSFLIDRGIATVDQVVQRFGEVQKTLSAQGCETEAVGQRIAWLTEVLRQVYQRSDAHRWTPQVIEGGLSRTDDPVRPDQP
jgi:hypothetical protein